MPLPALRYHGANKPTSYANRQGKSLIARAREHVFAHKDRFCLHAFPSRAYFVVRSNGWATSERFPANAAAIILLLKNNAFVAFEKPRLRKR